MYNGPHRKKLRLMNFDYSENGYYFVTICTKHRENFFGEIIDGKMILNEMGEIAENVLQNLPNFYKNYILDEYIFMPNHFHGIFIIDNSVENGFNPFSTKKHNLSQIIASFKSFTTRQIHQKFPHSEFGWQKSFYDVIIRNEEQLLKTREYIQNNPLKWDVDSNNKKNEKIVEELRKKKKMMEKQNKNNN